MRKGNGICNLVNWCVFYNIKYTVGSNSRQKRRIYNICSQFKSKTMFKMTNHDNNHSRRLYTAAL